MHILNFFRRLIYLKYYLRSKMLMIIQMLEVIINKLNLSAATKMYFTTPDISFNMCIANKGYKNAAATIMDRLGVERFLSM